MPPIDADAALMAAEGADPLGDPLAGQREEQQREGGADGERDRQRDGVSPMDPVAPATTIAASTGPAHGTYSTPSARPRPKPLLPWLN